MGQSSWISAGFNGSRSSCPALKAGISEEKSGISIPCSSKNCQDCDRPNASQWSQHRSGARSQNSARCAKTRSVDNTLRALPKIFPPVLPSQTCFTVLACIGFWNTCVIRGCGTCRNSKLLRHSLARPGTIVLRANVVLVGNVKVCWDMWSLQCLKTKGFRIEVCSSRDHTRPPKLSLARAMNLTVNARRFQRTRP